MKHEYLSQERIAVLDNIKSDNDKFIECHETNMNSTKQQN